LDTDKLEINHSSACGRLDVDFLVTSILKLKMFVKEYAEPVVPIVVIDINSINESEDFVLGICLKI
jgi:hypothetical protein